MPTHDNFMWSKLATEKIFKLQYTRNGLPIYYMSYSNLHPTPDIFQHLKFLMGRGTRAVT